MPFYSWIEGSSKTGALLSGWTILTVDVADDEDLRQAHDEEGPGGHVVVHQL